MANPTQKSPQRKWLLGRYSRLQILGLGVLVLLVGLFASLTYGATDIPLAHIIKALTSFDNSNEHLIIRTVRLPRSLSALMVGASLAVSGGLMQGLTQNPLASPDILGINAGAALAVVVVIFGFGSSSLPLSVGVAFLGAGVAAVTVYVLGSLAPGGPTPLNLTVAGAAVSALLSSLSAGVLLLSQRTMEEVRFWMAGSLASRDFHLFLAVIPWIAVGLLIALALGRQITTLSLGELIAQGLGQQTVRIKIFTMVSVVVLAGSAVALAGPIGFIGLVVPHFARGIMGIDYRWILPFSAVMGAALLVWADLAARLILRPMELPVGMMMALLGAPFFLYLVRWQVKRG
jgi:iron complex transport system permease protein